MSAKTESRIFIINEGPLQLILAVYPKHIYTANKTGDYTDSSTQRSHHAATHRIIYFIIESLSNRNRDVCTANEHVSTLEFFKDSLQNKNTAVCGSNHCVNIHVKRKNDGEEAHVSGNNLRLFVFTLSRRCDIPTLRRACWYYNATRWSVVLTDYVYL